MYKSLFISKSNSESEYLNQFLAEKNIKLFSVSFLKFQGVKFNIDFNYDIIFFTSPRSVLFFKEREKIPKNIKIACTGSKTAELLLQMGHKIDFRGRESGEIEKIADEFNIWSENRNVLFPISDISLKTISSKLNTNRVFEVIVYKTIINSSKIIPCDIYVFTSPSNVDGFLQKNDITNQSIIIAWGTSTEKHLVKNGFKVNHTLNDSSVNSLIKYLQKNF